MTFQNLSPIERLALAAAPYVGVASGLSLISVGAYGCYSGLSDLVQGLGNQGLNIAVISMVPLSYGAFFTMVGIGDLKRKRNAQNQYSLGRSLERSVGTVEGTRTIQNP